jgi:hypothetical protein
LYQNRGSGFDTTTTSENGFSGSDTTTTSENGSSTISYTGAVTAGDLASFSIQGSSISYSIKGKYFNDYSGSLTINDVIPNTPFKKANAKGTDVGLFISDSFALAVLTNEIPANVGNGQIYPIVVGMKNTTSNPDEIPGTYIFANYKSDTNETEYFKIVFSSDSTRGDGTFKMYNIDDASNTTPITTGCWKVSPNGSYINALEDTDTSSADCTVEIDETSTANNYHRMMIRVGSTKSFIVDHADGSGFGVGTEQRKLTSANVDGSYDSLWLLTPEINNTNLVYGEDFGFSHQIIDSAKGTVSNTSYILNPDDSFTLESTPWITYNLHLNTYCDFSNGVLTQTPVDGMVCVEGTNNDSTLVYNAFVDTNDKYYIAVPAPGSSYTEFNIGG